MTEVFRRADILDACESGSNRLARTKRTIRKLIAGLTSLGALVAADDAQAMGRSPSPESMNRLFCEFRINTVIDEVLGSGLDFGQPTKAAFKCISGHNFGVSATFTADPNDRVHNPSGRDGDQNRLDLDNAILASLQMRMGDPEKSGPIVFTEIRGLPLFNEDRVANARIKTGYKFDVGSGYLWADYNLNGNNAGLQEIGAEAYLKLSRLELPWNESPSTINALGRMRYVPPQYTSIYEAGMGIKNPKGNAEFTLSLREIDDIIPTTQAVRAKGKVWQPVEISDKVIGACGLHFTYNANETEWFIGCSTNADEPFNGFNSLKR